MRILEPVDFDFVTAHLNTRKTGVQMPGNPPEHTCFRVQLDDDDVRRLVLWCHFEGQTRDRNCRVIDVLPESADNPRVRSFLDGNPARGRGPVDLRIADGLEPVIVTNDLNGDFLSIIDGNHRMIAQQLSGRGFQGVRAFVSNWPPLFSWAYMPVYYKDLWKL